MAEVSCLDDPCSGNLGACCLPGGCLDNSPDACVAADGEWLGAGTDCAAGFCEASACCRPGICDDLPFLDCQEAGGTFVPDPASDADIDTAYVEHTQTIVMRFSELLTTVSQQVHRHDLVIQPFEV